ncbi:MAG: type II toxin-antitoxin system HicB family antitoxin [Thermodesulfobacteriota bacterium]|jgi:predicted RNase H-like HicB family nuclease
MKTIIFKVDLTSDEDGRWSAAIPSLPGCSSWGYSQQEALANIRDAAEAYLEDMRDAEGSLPSIPSAIQVIDEPAVAVSV